MIPRLRFKASVGVVGFGAVGQELCRQVVDVGSSVKLISDSSGALTRFGEGGFTKDELNALASAKNAGQNLKSASTSLQGAVEFFEASTNEKAYVEFAAAKQGRVALADCSASGSTFSTIMRPVLEARGSDTMIAMANKKPVSGAQSDYDWLLDSKHRVGIESTCGAGLPVFSTLTRVADSGDVVTKIEGQLSGSIGYILSALDEGYKEGQTFSKIVREAKANGYTEPDPRDDLSGTDVARKALILARTTGQKMELSNIEVEPLFPESFASLSVDEFMERLDELDDSVYSKVANAAKNGKKLRYAASILPGQVNVGLVEVDGDSPLAGLKGTDNLISITTKWYNNNALVVRGPGAGIEVTAAGVLSDIAYLSRNS